MAKLKSIEKRVGTVDTKIGSKIDPKVEHEKTRGTATERGYNHNWKRIRDLKLKDDPICERCFKAGRVVVAVLVHHKDRNPMNNEPRNHESLCASCHHDEHKGEWNNKRTGGCI